jgi:adenylate cyclase
LRTTEKFDWVTRRLALATRLIYPMNETIDFAAEGLLDGLDGEARRERLDLLQRLSADGVTLEELRAAAENGTMVFLGAERLVGGGSEYTLREIAKQTGVDLRFVRELMRASGVAVPADDERALGPGDLALLKLIMRYRELGLADEDVFEVARVLARGLTPVADTMRRIVLKLALRPGASEEELAASFAEVAAQLVPGLEPLLGETIRLHLRNVVLDEAVSAAERSAGALPGARDVGICFADLVGFTRAGELLAPDELGEIAGRLEEAADRTVQPPVRIVKTLGDGIMLVSPDLPPLVDTALSLVDSAEADARLPQLRAGIAYGPALSRAADWYGRPVNLASRVTDIARPGSVLTHHAVREAIRDGGFKWSYAGPRRLRGIREPVRLYRVRRERES